jgi:F0F1-type ATP synthase membrane subunit b/b'
MDPAVAGALVGAGFTTAAAVATQIVAAARRERERDIAARNATDTKELRELLEPAAMEIGDQIRRAEAAVDSELRSSHLAQVTDSETDRLADDLAILPPDPSII